MLLYGSYSTKCAAYSATTNFSTEEWRWERMPNGMRISTISANALCDLPYPLLRGGGLISPAIIKRRGTD